MKKPPSFVYLNRILEGKLPEEVELYFTDRYKELGIPLPNPKTMCRGECEGIGFIPVYLKEGDRQYDNEGRCHCTEDAEEDERLIKRWHEAEEKEPTKDGWHFVVCPDCEGTGSQYGVITGEEQSCSGEESNEFVVDLKQKPVPNRKATRTRTVKAVGVGIDSIPGAEIWDSEEDSEIEVVDTVSNALQGVY